MFERYTEDARRSLFFARYEAHQFGARSIEPDLLLLGLLRDEQSVAARILLDRGMRLESVREAVASW